MGKDEPISPILRKQSQFLHHSATRLAKSKLSLINRGAT